jgi:hypothetical protein
MVATESINRGSGGVSSSFFVEEEGDWVVCPNFRGIQTFGGSKLSGDPNFRGIQTFGGSKLSGNPNFRGIQTA